MGSIRENIDAVNRIKGEAAVKSGRKAEDVLLCAVTKTRTADEINEAIDLGVTDIGENKVQEIMDKYDSVKPVRWHLIGHLQTNKVKYIIDKVYMIHSVDSVHLMEAIDRPAKQHDVVMKILIQINISGEETKFGIRPDQIDEMIKCAERLSNVKVCGLMTILPKVDNCVSLRLHFVNIRQIYIDISQKKYNNISMQYLSMGMSGDFEEAIEEGSNMVRIGRAVFGERNYCKADNLDG